MAEVRYSTPDDHWFSAERDVPSSHDFAVTYEGKILRRTRSNGQTFDLTYRTEGPARAGLSLAHREFSDECVLWRRYP